LIPTAPPVTRPNPADVPAAVATAGAADVAADVASDVAPDVAVAPAVEGAATIQTANQTEGGAAVGGASVASGASDAEVEFAPVPGATFAEIPVERIHANAKQPRQVFDEDALAELGHSIREFGVLQPVVVRPDGDGYELVMGERRLRAGASAGLQTIPAIVRSTADDAMLRDALLENIHRAQLNPLEEAAAYQQLLEEFGATHEELARRIGRSRPQVSNTIRLMNLPLAVQRRVAAGVLSAGHARALLGLDDPEQQDELAARIVAEGLSVRATEELVALAQRGGPAKKQTRTPARKITAPAVSELANRLSDVFDTRVRVDLGRRKGKITVEFASIDDLERIVGVMAPSVSGQLTGGRPTDADTAGENEP
jgi:ParB family chromosome partitioning protein